MATNSEPVIVTRVSTEEFYRDKIFTLPVGGLISVAYGMGVETFHNRCEKWLPAGSEFEVFPVPPGHSLYAQWGADLLYVIKAHTPVAVEN